MIMERRRSYELIAMSCELEQRIELENLKNGLKLAAQGSKLRIWQ